MTFLVKIEFHEEENVLCKFLGIRVEKGGKKLNFPIIIFSSSFFYFIVFFFALTQG